MVDKKKIATSVILGIISVALIVGCIISYKIDRGLIGLFLGFLSILFVLIFIVSLLDFKKEPEKIKQITLTMGDKDSSIDQLLEQAKLSMQLNNYDEADNILRGILIQDPNNNEALFLMSLIYNRKLDIKGSIRFLEKILESNSNDLRALIAIGSAYVVLRDDKALEYLQRALEIDSNNPIALSALGDYYAVKGDMEKSQEYEKKSREHSPPAFRVALNEADIARIRGEDALLDQLFKVLKLDPSNALHWLNIGNFALEHQEYETASKCFQKAAEIDPTLEGFKELLNELNEKRKETQNK